MEASIVTSLANVNSDWQNEHSDLLLKIDRELRKILEGQLFPENKHQQLKSTASNFKNLDTSKIRRIFVGATESSSRDKDERIPLGTDSANVTSHPATVVDNNSNKNLLNAKFHEALLDLFRQDRGAAGQSNRLESSSVKSPLNTKLQNSTKLKNIDQTLIKSMHRETRLLLRQKQLIPYKKQSLNQHACNLELFDAGKFEHNFGHVKVVSAPSESYDQLRCNNTSATAMGLDTWCPTKRFKLEYFSLRLKLKKLKRTNRLNSMAATHKTSAIEVSKPYKFIDKIICTLKAKFLPLTSTDASNTKVSKPSEKSMSYETFQSPTTVVNGLTSAQSTIPVYQVVVKKLPAVNRKPMISQPVRTKPNSRSLKYNNELGLRFTNYQDLNRPESDLTIEQFARYLNLVRTDSLPLKKSQFQSRLFDVAAIGSKNIRKRLKLH